MARRPRKRRYWGEPNVAWLSLGVAVVSMAIGLTAHGWTRLAFAVAAVAFFAFGRSIQRKPRVELESDWRQELLAFSNDLAWFVPLLKQAFRQFVNSNYCLTKSLPGVTVTDSWSQMFSQAMWPGGNDGPLNQWRDRFYATSDPYTQTVCDFAFALFGKALVSDPERARLDDWRRRTARTIDVWGERLRNNVRGFQEFLDHYAVAEEYASFVKVLAYLEIGKASQTNPSRKPIFEFLWWLGERWNAP